MTLDTKGRILRAKIRLGKSHPFFAYLLSFASFKEEKDEQRCNTMGINKNADVVYYEPWVGKLNDDEIMGLLAHEIMHVATATSLRCGTRDKQINNIASDIVINNILLSNQLTLPDPKKHGGCVPQGNEMKIPELGITIKEVDKKCTEEIYDIIYKKCPKITIVIGRPANGEGKGDEDADGDGKGKGKSLSTFDVHIYDEGDGSDEKAKEADRALAKEWGKRMVQAQSHSKSRGVDPAGMERLIGELVNNKVSRKRLLAKYITNEQFVDFTYSRMNRKSHGIGIYLPTAKKENINIAFGVDTSGSVSQEELTTFLSEIVHLVKSVNNVKALIMECDSEVHGELEVRNGDIAKILSMKPKGGGGTAFSPIIEKMLKEKRDIKLLIYFTDGEGEEIKWKPRDLPFKIIWCITKGGTDRLVKDKGLVIKLE